MLSPLGSSLKKKELSPSRSRTTGGAATLHNPRPALHSPPATARPGPPGHRASRRGRPEGPAGAENGFVGRHVCSARRNASAVCSSIRGAWPASCLLFFFYFFISPRLRSETCVGCPGVPEGVAPVGLGSGKQGNTAPRSPGGGVPPAGSLGPSSTEMNVPPPKSLYFQRHRPLPLVKEGRCLQEDRNFDISLDFPLGFVPISMGVV